MTVQKSEMLHVRGGIISKLKHKAKRKSADSGVKITWQMVARDILSKGVSE